MGLTAGPHLPVTARKKEKGCGAGPAVGREVGWRGPLRAGEGGWRPRSLRGLKEKERRKGLGRLKEKGERRGSEGFSLFFKFFSNSFFKLSNFNQTEIHAFES
jgi:hypothetical protein